MAPRSGRAECCSCCNEPAVILTQSGRLCASHLVASIETRVRENIREHALIRPGDHLAVGLSGGKDSTALLMILREILPEWPDVTITAVTIDEGIAGYREETLAAAVRLTERLGISHRVLAFGDLFGADLDALLAGSGSRDRACTICGVLRRKALAEGARQVGATRIATGHNLDDEAQSVLMNLLRGDLVRLAQDSSSGEPDCFIPRIKPLSTVTEKEIVTYLFVREAFLDLPECPYAGTALRSEIRVMLGELEDRYPGTCEALMRSQEAIRERVPSPPVSGDLARCGRCGALCNSGICQACRILESLGIR